MATVRIGVDIGQRVDPSAICVVAVEQWADLQWHFVARHVERLPLGTTYPAVVDRLVEIHGKLASQTSESETKRSLPYGSVAYPYLRPPPSRMNVRLWVDATGVGLPIVDLLREARLPVTPVYLTGSDKVTKEGGELRLGKGLLVSRLQVLASCNRLHLDKKMPETQALLDEIKNYEIRTSDAGHTSFGAFKTGAHDDLVTALALACWQKPLATWADIPQAPDRAPWWAKFTDGKPPKWRIG